MKRASHLRLVTAGGVPVAPVIVAPGLASAPLPAAAVPARAERPRSLSRPLGRRVVQAANDVAVLALALLAGLRPQA